MPESFSILAQSDPLAATLTVAYTVPASTEAVISSIVVCNRSGTATSFRLAFSPGGVAISNEHYTHFDIPIGGNDSYIATIGVTLEATDVVRVQATLATLSFNIFGTEITA